MARWRVTHKKRFLSAMLEAYQAQRAAAFDTLRNHPDRRAARRHLKWEREWDEFVSAAEALSLAPDPLKLLTAVAGASLPAGMQLYQLRKGRWCAYYLVDFLKKTCTGLLCYPALRPDDFIKEPPQKEHASVGTSS